jgi:hypothetical protein
VTGRITVPVPSSRPRPALALVHSDGQPLDRRPSADPDAVHVRAMSGLFRRPEAEVRDILASLALSWLPSAMPGRAWRPSLHVVSGPRAAQAALADLDAMDERKIEAAKAEAKVIAWLDRVLDSEVAGADEPDVFYPPLEAEADAGEENWYCAEHDAEAAEYDVEPEAGL